MVIGKPIGSKCQKEVKPPSPSCRMLSQASPARQRLSTSYIARQGSWEVIAVAAMVAPVIRGQLRRR